MRVRDRTGWAIVGGFALYERADASTEASGSERFTGVPHFWNISPRGLWLDSTPRAPEHSRLVLIESALSEVPPPPYAANAHSPMVVVAVEGLCNRLRAVLSYRIMAHEAGRPLVVVWKRDDYCPGYFLDVFVPIPGVRFVKTPPEGRPLSSLHVATDTHAAIKDTPKEAYSYAVLSPSDATRAAVAMQVKACGPRYAAMHIRRTDLFTALPAQKHTPAAAFEHFADALTSAKANVFIAADNAESQRWMSEHCGGRARVHKPIQASDFLHDHMHPHRCLHAHMPICTCTCTCTSRRAAPCGRRGCRRLSSTYSSVPRPPMASWEATVRLLLGSYLDPGPYHRPPWPSPSAQSGHRY